MAITLEDILLERAKRKESIDGGPEYTEPETRRIDQEELDYILSLNEKAISRGVTPPSPVATDPTTSILSPILRGAGRAYTSALETLGSGAGTVPPEVLAPTSSEIEARRRGIIGVGEAATSVATGLAGGAVGMLGAGEQLARDVGGSIFREGGYQPSPTDPKYWTKLVDNAKKLSSEFTYQPRTPEGQAIMQEGIAPIMESISEFSRRASEAPILRMFLTDDQRKAVAYSHELLTMIALGELGSATVGAIGRKRIGDFKKTFIDAAKEPESGGPATEKLAELGAEITEKARNTPEIQRSFSPERVEELRARQTGGDQRYSALDTSLETMYRTRLADKDPEVVASLQREGQMILDRLSENPDNTQYQASAVNFFEKTRGSGIRSVEALRNRVSDSMGGISEPELSPSTGVRETVNPPYVRGVIRETPIELEETRLQNRMDFLREEMESGRVSREALQERLDQLSSHSPGLKSSERGKIANEEIPTPVPEDPSVTRLRNKEITLEEWLTEYSQKQEEQASTPGVNPDIDFRRAMGGVRAGDNLLLSMYGRMVQGDLPEPFPTNRQSNLGRQFKEVFDRGEIKSPEDAIRIGTEIAKGIYKASPTPTASNVPAWAIEAQDRYIEQGNFLGVTERVLELAREGKWTAGQIANEIPELRKFMESKDPAIMRDGENIVRSIRNRANIPSLDDIRAGKTIPTSNSILSDTSRSVSRGTPSSKSVEEKLQAVEDSNFYANEASLTKHIRDSIESGNDIAKDVYKAVGGGDAGRLALVKYKQAFDAGREGINSSNERGIMRIVQDIANLFAFEEPGAPLSHSQKMAAQRLSADAAKTGNTLDDTIRSINVDPAAKARVSEYAATEMPPSSPPNGEGPKNMPLDGKAMDGTDPVVRREVEDGRFKPPVYTNEAKVLQLAEPQDAPIKYSFTTPIRTAKKFSEDLSRMIFPPLREAAKIAKEEVKDMHNQLRKLERALKYPERRNITKNVEEGTPENLRGNEITIYNTLEEGINQHFDRINQVREAVGNPTLEIPDDPVGFMRAIESARANGGHVHLINSSPEAIAEIIAKPEYSVMPKTLTQRAFRLTGEKDIFRQFDNFSRQVIEQSNMAPVTAKLREFANYNGPDVIGGEGKFNLGTQNPGLKRFLEEIASYSDGLPVDYIKNLDPFLQKARENMSWSMLGLNLHSTAAQPFSLLSTWHQVGTIDLVNAIMDSAKALKGDQSAREFALANSKVLPTRSGREIYGGLTSEKSGQGFLEDVQTFFREGSYAVREGRLRDISREFGQVATSMLEAFDHESAVITWNAFKRNLEKRGIKGEDLYNIADDGVVTTQSSGSRWDVTPLQRIQLFRTLTQFQSFTLTDWNFMVNDVLKWKKGASASEIGWSIGRYFAAIEALDGVTALLGIDPPTPTPIRDFMKSRENDDDLLTTAVKVGFGTVAPYVPVVGPIFKYGRPGGPLVDTVTQLAQSALDRPGSKGFLEPTSELLGIPGAAQYWRWQRGNPNATIVERLMNYNPQSPKGGSSLSGGIGKDLGGGLR